MSAALVGTGWFLGVTLRWGGVSFLRDGGSRLMFIHPYTPAAIPPPPSLHPAAPAAGSHSESAPKGRRSPEA